jgi:hypothetical protein
MILRALTNGAMTGTDTLTVTSRIVGGVLITADSTNAATVVIRRLNDTGKPILDVTTKIPLWITGPFSTEEALQVHVSVSGTGAEAQVYEWVS